MSIPVAIDVAAPAGCVQAFLYGKTTHEIGAVLILQNELVIAQCRRANPAANVLKFFKGT